MDLDLEQIHNILCEANLPSSINFLKNPTEAFMVSLIDAFLKRFHIDVSNINKATLEQLDVCEDNNIISLINLHTAMVYICDRIYVKDLCITDITSPGSKRVRKQAKFLANFILYATNKELEIEGRINEIRDQAIKLQKILEEKEEKKEAINQHALHVSNQLTLKEKLKTEIQQAQLKSEKNNKKLIELIGKMSTIEKKKQKGREHLGNYKAKISKLNKTTVELQTQIVKSPEEYKRQLSELEQQKNAKNMEREELLSKFQEKKCLIEHIQNMLTNVEEKYENFTEIRKILDKMKNIKTQEDSIKKEVDVYKRDVVECEKTLKTQKHSLKQHEIGKIHTKCEEPLSHLHKLCSELLSKETLNKEILEGAQKQDIEDCHKLKINHKMIKELDEEIIIHLRNYQEMYDKEILKEQTLQDALMKKK